MNPQTYYGDVQIFSGDLKISGDQNSIDFENTSNNTGNLIVSGDIVGKSMITASDKRIKKNIEVIKNIKSKILSLDVCKYNLINGDNNIYYGFIAQDFEKIFPECTRKIKGDDICRLDYNSIFSLLFSATKEINKEIEELRNEHNKNEMVTHINLFILICIICFIYLSYPNTVLS